MRINLRVAPSRLVDAAASTPVTAGERQAAAQEARAARQAERHWPAALAQQPIGELTPRRLLGVVEDMAELVRARTGFVLDTSQVRTAIVSRREARELILADAHARVGDVAAAGWLERLQALLVQRHLVGALAGVYLPSQATAIVIGENAKHRSLDGLRKVMFHELLHAGQHQSHPGFFTAINQAHLEMNDAEKFSGKESAAYLDARDTLNARMTFLEGHPTFWEQVLTAAEFPGGVVPWRETLASHVMLLMAEGKDKVKQYVLGAKVFASLQAMGPGGDAIIKMAYQNPALVDVLLKTRGTVELSLAPQANEALMRLLIDALRPLSMSATALRVVLRPSSS